jgi:23S rRNA pseudouridine2605 synthase
MAPERLQKVLAAAGLASRRQSEALIAAGRVSVDGHVAMLGEQADPASSIILVDGRPLPGAVSHVYLAMHKPAGVASTVRDRHAPTAVLDLVPTALVPDGARIYPVGRLDQDSEGLLLLTNDGDWADRVLHPRFGVEREYAVGLGLPLDAGQTAALRRGVQLDEGLARLAQPLRLQTSAETRRLVALLDTKPGALTWYRAVLGQGWKRQLRRVFGAVGAPVDRLVRVRMGSVRLDDLRSGQTRILKAPEIRRLGVGQETAPRGAERGRRQRLPERR